MRVVIPAALAGVLSIASPAFGGELSVFRPDAAVLVAHDEHEHDHERDNERDHDHDHDHDHDGDRKTSREDIRERRRELRQRERDLRLEERARARRSMKPRAWVGVGAGVGFASVDTPCQVPSSYDCDESSSLGTYSANFTVTGRNTGVRLRGVRAQDKGQDSRTPYELAAMVGSRFGHSNWYGFVGGGRILHADDEFQGDTHGFAWEFVFAPTSHSGMGFELSFQGNTGRDVDYGVFNLGFRFGKME